MANRTWDLKFHFSQTLEMAVNSREGGRGLVSSQTPERPDFDLLFLIVAWILCRRKEKLISKLKESTPKFIRLVFEV